MRGIRMQPKSGGTYYLTIAEGVFLPYYSWCENVKYAKFFPNERPFVGPDDFSRAMKWVFKNGGSRCCVDAPKLVITVET